MYETTTMDIGDQEFSSHACHFIGSLQMKFPDFELRAHEDSKGNVLQIDIGDSLLTIMYLNCTLQNGDQIWYVKRHLLEKCCPDDKSTFCTVKINNYNISEIIDTIIENLSHEIPASEDDEYEQESGPERILTGFSLSNFKSFESEQRFPIKPITLIFGPNSGGKSSIIQAMLLANEAVQKGNLNVFTTELGGSSVELGGFQQYIRQGKLDSILEFSILLDPENLRHDLSFTAFWDAFDSISFKVSLGMLSDFFGNPIIDSVPKIKFLTIEGDGKMLLRLRNKANGEFSVDEIDLNHYLFMTEVFEMHGLDKDELLQSFQQQIFDMISKNKLFIRGVLPYEIEKKIYQSNNDDMRFGKSIKSIYNDIHKKKKKFDDVILGCIESVDILGCIFYWLDLEVRDQLSKLQYLGPLRSYPSRNLVTKEHYDLNWFAGGAYAWDIVKDDQEVREKINAWLGNKEKLNSTYEFVSYNYEHIDEGESISDNLEGVGGLEIRKIAVPMIKKLLMIDKVSKTTVTHRDVGIGISQVLPVLVSAYGSKEKIIAMEQPEIHLHPALQAELADVFIESAIGKNQNTFILETHSEHLILRILRRIRETEEDELAEGLTPITPDQVAVLYVQPGENGSEVIHIPVNKEGEFERPWPEGFFSERAKELF